MADWVQDLKTAKDLDKQLEAVEGFRAAVERLAELEEGSRNHELNKVAFIGGTLIKAGKAQKWWVEQELRDACEKNGYIEDDGASAFEKTLTSGISGGMDAEPEYDNPLFKLVVPASKLGGLPKTNWLIEGLFQEATVAFVAAPGGTGKSFFALDVAAHLAESNSWHGRRIYKNCETIYVCPEGTGSLFNRVSAWETQNGRTMTGVDFFPFTIKLGTATWDYFVDYCETTKPGLVVIDTLARTAVGLDENKPTEMSKATAAFDAIREACGATVLICHHTSKEGSMRGASSLHDNVETVLRLGKPQGVDYINLWADKQKDGEGGHLGKFELRSVNLTNDISSAVFTPYNDYPYVPKLDLNPDAPSPKEEVPAPW